MTIKDLENAAASSEGFQKLLDEFGTVPAYTTAGPEDPHRLAADKKTRMLSKVKQFKDLNSATDEIMKEGSK